MKWLLKISYSWGDEEPYQEFNSFKEAWDTAKKDACNEVMVLLPPDILEAFFIFFAKLSYLFMRVVR